MLRSPLPWLVPAALLVVGSLGTNRGSDSYPAVAVCSIAAGAALVLACHRGRAAVLLSGVAVGGYFAAGLENGPMFLALPLALLAASLRHRPRVLLPAGVAAVVLAVTGLVVRAANGDGGPQVFWQSVGVAAMSSVAAFGGWWLVDRGRMRAELAGRAATEERLRMAQDLHDGVGHGLAVIAMQAGVALHVLEKDPTAARRSLEAIRDTSRESLESLRAELARMSGSEAPRRATPGLADLDPLLERVRAGGLAVERRGDPGALEGAADHTAYVVVQESLTNVLRHARATRAAVVLERTDVGLTVIVSDDGVGAAAAVGQDGGMGIAGMRSRVEALGGTLQAGPDATGFRVRAQIPVAR
ncbi:sensor histidine kinase [Nocardioides sp. YIM 152315]|uniref:sensor histidine kinase n=1 Tax=Nocardioides sp. YIM 152315 TaxID=3031760 RepID=UPI0023DC0622|nr:sensor histidine kinase [Nocardioides sp. YIM 152315]MDF1605994.1 sensor histidine kinase [Nocardioides sp. YIM 152315]